MNETYNPQPAAPPPVAAPTAAPPPPVAAPYPVIVDRKSPVLAAFLSFFPGLGHLYLGLYPRAFAIGGAFILGIMMTSHGGPGEIFGPLVAFVWFFGVIDAVRQAKAINRGEVAEAGFAGDPKARRAAAGSGALTWGIVLIGLGGLWLLNSYDLLDRVLDAIPTWGGPAAFILFGLFLVVSHIRKARRENESQVGMPPRSN
jgi:hypothetical protein